MKIVTTSQMKEIEKKSDENGVSYLQLMKNAGTLLGQWTEKFISDQAAKKTVLLSGSGNNGGDCFVAAEYLRKKGYEVSVALVCGIPQTETARSAFALMDGVKVFTGYDDIKNAVMEADIIVDGIFGTGFHGELDESIRAILNMNEEAFRVAADIPSGGNAKNGAVSDGCFRADYTITFGFKKFGMTQYPLKDYCGKIISADIGIPDSCSVTEPELKELSMAYVPAMLKKRSSDSHKGTYGTLISVTGSASMPGAAHLSGRAALRSGLGLLKQCSVPENIPAAAAVFPEPVYIRMKTDADGFYTEENAQMLTEMSEKAGAMLIGCGLGTAEGTKNLVKKLVENSSCPVILDADGINCIAECTDIIDRAKSAVVLTPHPAEMGRLLSHTASEIQSDRYGACISFTEQHPDAVAVLKGAGTIISSSEGMYINNTGNPGMSTGGSGDVLAGMIASFAAQGISPLNAAVLGTYIHGKAGDIAAEKFSMHSMLPGDIINELHEVFREAE